MSSNAANSFVGRVSAIVSSAHEFLLNALSCMSKDTNQARCDTQLSVGEHVLLSIKCVRLFHVGWKKLLNKYLGPSQVLSMKRVVVYEMCLPACMSIMFNAVHVSLIERFTDGNRGSAAPPAE